MGLTGSPITERERPIRVGQVYQARDSVFVSFLTVEKRTARGWRCRENAHSPRGDFSGRRLVSDSAIGRMPSTPSASCGSRRPCSGSRMRWPASRQPLPRRAMSTENTYPYDEGDMTVLGPEIFASRDGAVICWKGENYVSQETAMEPDEMTAQDVVDALRLALTQDEVDVGVVRYLVDRAPVNQNPDSSRGVQLLIDGIRDDSLRAVMVDAA